MNGKRLKIIEDFFKLNPDEWLVFEYWYSSINLRLKDMFKMTRQEFAHEIKRIKNINRKVITWHGNKDVFYLYEVKK